MRESSFVLVVDVSIVIPAYRAEGFLRRAIESVLAQTFARWELIVVADGGVDDGAVLRSQGVDDARIRFDSTGRIGGGAGTARNVGIASSWSRHEFAPRFSRIHRLPCQQIASEVTPSSAFR